MSNKTFAKALLERLQNSCSDAIIPSSIPDGFMTDSESAHDAILCILEMLGIEELVTVEHAVHYGILHYCFHFHIEEDPEDLWAKQEISHH